MITNMKKNMIKKERPCVLTIGKFECLHRGHQKLLELVKAEANRRGLSPAMMVFSPHPYIFLGDAHYTPLFTDQERDHILQGMGITDTRFTPFDNAFANLSPEKFCHFIFTTHQAKAVVVGENFSFGKGRQGGTGMLVEYARQNGCHATVVPMQQDRESHISTSNIRALLNQGKVAEANRQLGFHFFITGAVTQGRQLGRTLNFPTLNIYPQVYPQVYPQANPAGDKFLPPRGVYVTRTTVDGQAFASVTNIGYCPTVSGDQGQPQQSVETHVLDASLKEMYGAFIKVEILDFIRPEMKFDSLAGLTAQIAKDVAEAKRQSSI